MLHNTFSKGELSQSTEKLNDKRVNENANHRRVKSDGGTENAM